MSSFRRLASTDSGLIAGSFGRGDRKPRRRSCLDHDITSAAASEETDGIDGEALVRALLAHKRGEPRVCAMVKRAAPEEEDRRLLLSRAQSADQPSRSGTSISVKGLYVLTGDIWLPARYATTGGSGWMPSRPAMVAYYRII